MPLVVATATGVATEAGEVTAATAATAAEDMAQDAPVVMVSVAGESVAGVYGWVKRTDEKCAIGIPGETVDVPLNNNQLIRCL